MPTLLQINVVANIGSTGRIAEQIGLVALQNGWRSFIAYGRAAGKSRSELIPIGGALDRLWHVFQTRVFDNHGFCGRRATQQLIERIKTIHPDVIHLHNLHGYYLHIGELFEYLKTCGKPIVWTLHDCWAFTGHCTHYELVNCQRWKTECFDCPKKHIYPASFLLDRSRRNFRLKKALLSQIPRLTLITPSHWLADQVRQSFLKNYPIRVIPNGIDLDAFKPNVSDFRQRYGLDNTFMILGVAGRWIKEKGYDYFLRLAERLKARWRIVLVGLSAKQKKSLPSGVIGIEKTHSVQELAAIYSAADVFVNLTLEDNFPTVNLESLACGTPVATFNSGGSPECVDEKTGFVVPKGDLDAVVAALEHIEAKGKSAYSAACRARAEQLFDKNRRFQEIFEFYQTLLCSF